MKKQSLTAQLLRNVGLPVIIVILIVGVAAYFSVVDEINEVYDSQMITSANAMWLMNQDEDTTRTEIKMRSKNVDLNDGDQQVLDEYAKWRSIRLWKKGKLVIYSENSPVEALPPHAKGFADISREDGQWRLFTLPIPDKQIVVEVAEKHEARIEIIKHILFVQLLPLLISLPVIALLIWKGIQWGLRDLRRFAIVIKQRSSDDLSKVEKEKTPEEIEPLADSINLLLGKLESSLAQERIFTDNAAHELRTPLATLGIQADVVLSSKDEAERESAVLELAKGVRRASRMADQLLTLARIRQQPIEATSLNLYIQAREAIKKIYPKARKKLIECSLSGDETLEVLSKKPLLTILLNNLLDNAVKYTPDNGEVRVMIGLENGLPMLAIEDTGSGIPEHERENVFKRFYRLHDNPETGSGLGLAIVRSISELIHTEVSFYTPQKASGFGVKLVFKARD